MRVMWPAGRYAAADSNSCLACHSLLPVAGTRDSALIGQRCRAPLAPRDTRPVGHCSTVPCDLGDIWQDGNRAEDSVHSGLIGIWAIGDPFFFPLPTFCSFHKQTYRVSPIKQIRTARRQPENNCLKNENRREIVGLDTPICTKTHTRGLLKLPKSIPPVCISVCYNLD